LKRLLYVAFFLQAGLFLILVPWFGFWERNYFAGWIPVLREVLTNNFVRGAVSGVGFVNVGAGLADLAKLISAGRVVNSIGASGEGSIGSGLANEE
jgi:hypothetical protein